MKLSHGPAGHGSGHGGRFNTVRLREIGLGTGISEASKRVPIFLHDVRGGKQVSSYFGQELRQTK